MKTNTIEIRVSCYTCTPQDYEIAMNHLDDFFEMYNTDGIDAVEWPNFSPFEAVTIRVNDIPDDQMEWATEKIEEAMLDISSWNIE